MHPSSSQPRRQPPPDTDWETFLNYAMPNQPQADNGLPQDEEALQALLAQLSGSPPDVSHFPGNSAHALPSPQSALALDNAQLLGVIMNLLQAQSTPASRPQAANMQAGPSTTREHPSGRFNMPYQSPHESARAPPGTPHIPGHLPSSSTPWLQGEGSNFGYAFPPQELGGASSSSSAGQSAFVPPPEPRPRRTRAISQASTSPSDGGVADDPETQAQRDASAEEKRRRNTAASARFRNKKKTQVVNLERTISDLTGRAEDLEREAADLRRENGWLKEIIILKGKTMAGQTPQFDSGSGERRS